MSSKRLVPLALLLVVLVIAAVVLKRRPAPTSLSDETGFERLVPRTLCAERISGFDLYRGAQPDAAVQLRRRDGTWVVTSHYDAPGNVGKIEALLDKISTLEGELRSDKAELLKDFRLEEAQALHLRVYTKSAEAPAIHLLAGKGGGRDGFLRVADDTRVYSVNMNLRSEAGLYGDETDKTPPAKPWLELQIHNVPKEQITAVELWTPERRLSFAHQKQSPSARTDTLQQAAEPKNLAAEAGWGWELVAPEIGYAVKQGPLDGLVSTLRTLRAEEIVDPANIATYGLDAPAYRASLTVQTAGQGVKKKTLFIGHEVPRQTGGRYARLDHAGPIYVMSRWSFDRLFPQGKELLELPSLYTQPEEVMRLTWRQDGKSWTVERRHANPQERSATRPASPWRFAHLPQATVEEQTVDSVLEAIRALTTEDWIERLVKQTDKQRSVLALVLTLRDNRREHMTVDKASDQGEDHYYIHVRSAPGIFVVPSAVYKTLTEAFAKLLPSTASSAAETSATP